MLKERFEDLRRRTLQMVAGGTKQRRRGVSLGVSTSLLDRLERFHTPSEGRFEDLGTRRELQQARGS